MPRNDCAILSIANKLIELEIRKKSVIFLCRSVNQNCVKKNHRILEILSYKRIITNHL